MGRIPGEHHTAEKVVHARDTSLNGPPIWDDHPITVEDLSFRGDCDPLLARLEAVHPERKPKG